MAWLGHGVLGFCLITSLTQFSLMLLRVERLGTEAWALVFVGFLPLALGLHALHRWLKGDAAGIAGRLVAGLLCAGVAVLSVPSALVGWRLGQFALFGLSHTVVALGMGYFAWLAARGVTTLAARGETMSSRHNNLLALLLIALAGAGFVAVGAGIGLCFLFLILFTAAAVFILPLIGSRSPQHLGVGVRLILAVTVAFSATWLGVAWNVEQIDIYSSGPPDREAWRAAHGVSEGGPYQTLMVTGFPIQRIEGHGNAGAAEYLPPGKGLWALVSNFGLLLTAGVALAHAIPKHRALLVARFIALAVPVGGWLGWWKLVVMLD